MNNTLQTITNCYFPSVPSFPSDSVLLQVFMIFVYSLREWIPPPTDVLGQDNSSIPDQFCSLHISLVVHSFGANPSDFKHLLYYLVFHEATNNSLWVW
jgi:hypothetical protein